MKIVIAGLTAFTISMATAQVWRQGVVVLKDERVIAGKVALIKPGLCLLDTNGTVVVYPPHKVSAVRYYDKQADINRHFMTWKNELSTVPVGYFLEVVSTGAIKIVRRNTSMTDDALMDNRDFEYYFIYQDNLIPIRKFISQLFDRLPYTEHEQLVNYATAHRLSVRAPADAIRLVLFYNKEVQAPTSIAGL